MWLVEGKDTEKLMNILQCAEQANNVEVEKICLREAWSSEDTKHGSFEHMIIISFHL